MRRWTHGPLSALVSGILLALALPAPSLFPLAFVALAPYLNFLIERPPWRQVVAAHLLLSLTYFGLVLYWIPRVLTVYGRLDWWAALPVFLLMLLALSLHLLPFTAGVRALVSHSRPAALIAAPALWTIGELLRNDWIVSGFPWCALGYSQSPFRWLIQITDLVGVYGLSWLVALCAPAIIVALRWRRYQFLGAVLALLWICCLYGGYRLYLWTPAASDTVRVALVQPHIQLSQQRNYYTRVYYDELADYYEQAALAGAQIVVFPEAPNPFLFEYDFYFTRFWKELVTDFEVPLLLNGTALGKTPDEKFNSIFVIDRSGMLIHRYDKLHLVPFGEYLPYGEALGFSRPLVQQVGGFLQGTPVGRAAQLPDAALGLQLCYEAIFPELARQSVHDGAGLLVNLTNDLWFGRTSAPLQHLEMARFRAIEQRRPMLRAANSGISAIIDAKGRTQNRLGWDQKGILMGQVNQTRHTSLYSRIGEAGVFSLIILTLGAAAIPLARARKRKGK